VPLQTLVANILFCYTKTSARCFCCVFLKCWRSWRWWSTHCGTRWSPDTLPSFAFAHIQLSHWSRLVPAVLAEQALVEHALRHTLVADALALQIKLPPEGVPAPVARASAAVAGGAPVVETLASSSLWAVSLLKALSQV